MSTPRPKRRGNGYKEPTVDGMVKAIHALSTAKGWWTECPETYARHMLMVTEIAEASDSFRKGEPHTWFQKDGKPEGERIELADCVMRIMDYFGQRGWSLEEALTIKMQFNETRPSRKAVKRKGTGQYYAKGRLNKKAGAVLR